MEIIKKNQKGLELVAGCQIFFIKFYFFRDLSPCHVCLELTEVFEIFQKLQFAVCVSHFMPYMLKFQLPFKS